MTRVDEVCYRDAYARTAEAQVLEVAASDGPPLWVPRRALAPAAADPRHAAARAR